MNAPITNSSGSTNRIDQTGQPAQSVNMAQLTGAQGGDAPGMLHSAAVDSNPETVNRLHQTQNTTIPTSTDFINLIRTNPEKALESITSKNNSKSPLMNLLEPSLASMFEQIASTFVNRAREAVTNSNSQDSLAKSAISLASKPFAANPQGFEEVIVQAASKLMAATSISKAPEMNSLEPDLSEQVQIALHLLASPNKEEALALIDFSNAPNQSPPAQLAAQKEIKNQAKKLFETAKTSFMPIVESLINPGSYYQAYATTHDSIQKNVPSFLTQASELVSNAAKTFAEMLQANINGFAQFGAKVVAGLSGINAEVKSKPSPLQILIKQLVS
jgi:hypothetical protein